MLKVIDEGRIGNDNVRRTYREERLPRLFCQTHFLCETLNRPCRCSGNITQQKPDLRVPMYCVLSCQFDV